MVDESACRDAAPEGAPCALLRRSITSCERIVLYCTLSASVPLCLFLRNKSLQTCKLGLTGG